MEDLLIFIFLLMITTVNQFASLINFKRDVDLVSDVVVVVVVMIALAFIQS